MDAVPRELIESLHRAEVKYVLAVAGGGSGAAAALLGVPGASHTLLEVVVPYSESALVSFLGHPPAQFCSALTASLMARRAHDRARWLSPDSAVAGVAVTASLTTNRPKQGDHRVFLAVHDGDLGRTRSLTLTKGARDRAGEERVVDLLTLNLMAEVFRAGGPATVTLLPGEAIVEQTHSVSTVLAAFLRGAGPPVCVEIDGRARADGPRPGLLVPGSFNPQHDGHAGLAAVAQRLTGRRAALELSVANPDKPSLAPAEIRRRLALPVPYPVWLTRAPTFLDKARLFPGVTFAVGFDTAERVLAARYYGGEDGLRNTLEELRSLGASFLVAGRVGADRCFRQRSDLVAPEPFEAMFKGIEADVFRLDVSSTKLRSGLR